MKETAIVWFRQDLRLTDNPALHKAVALDACIIPVYIWKPQEEGEWAPGGASKVWLNQSLHSLDHDLRELGSRLIILEGDSLKVLQNLAEETDARHIYWNRRYEPASIARDTRIKQELQDQKLDVQSFNSALLFEPWEVLNKDGLPFRVFSPYWKNCLQRPHPPEPFPKPDNLKSPAQFPASLQLEKLELEPKIKWDSGIHENWHPGEAGALEQVERLIDEIIKSYETGRNIPSQSGVSRMSPYLHFGEVGPRQIWHRVNDALATKSGASLKRGAEVYVRELGWREFAYSLLYHFPTTPEKPLYPQFEEFPWIEDRSLLKRWQKGATGYPLVDAGMRELWHTGWMHNRVRMVVASFLVKDLLLPWVDGAKWFWDTLVDADLASNTMGWQWVAGCGADAAPYFRIFNPVLQGKKFDPEGKYVKRWVPELAKLHGDVIHEPWKLSEQQLKASGIVLGETYPFPIVEHGEARARALAALKVVQGKRERSSTVQTKTKQKVSK